MHVSAETMKTVAFVLLMLLVALYVHLSNSPRRSPRSLVDISRHREEAADAKGEGGNGASDKGRRR